MKDSKDEWESERGGEATFEKSWQCTEIFENVVPITVGRLGPGGSSPFGEGPDNMPVRRTNGLPMGQQ